MDETFELKRLDWDAWNIVHIARRGVTVDETDEVCLGDPVMMVSEKERFVLIGPTQKGRMIAVVIGPSPKELSVFYPFTARRERRKEC